MNGGQGEALFLDGVILICAVMAMVNAGRFKSRGSSAYLLAGAFLILGGTVYAYTLSAPKWLLGTGGAAVFLLLVADMVYRAGRSR